MATFASFDAFAREVDQMERRLAKETAREVTFEQAKQGQAIARRAASADLGGDPKFSGWAPTLDTQIKRTRGDGHVLLPTRSSAGPWTVAEQGRNRGETGRLFGPDIVQSGARAGQTRAVALRSRTRQRAISRRSRRRWNGVTAGKSTASEAVAKMERQLSTFADRGLKKAIGKHFDVS